MSTLHAFTNDILGQLDGVGIAELIRKKEVTALEVTEAAIARSQKMDPSIHAISENDYQRALTIAKAASQKGFFAGVPTFIKDMSSYAGMATRLGTKALENARFCKKNDGITSQILDQGFIVLGKSTMPEFGWTAVTQFPNDWAPATCNPWNTAHTVGGSSGGAGALVAAGVVAISHTADGGGSTRIPASACGLIGLKPTRKRLRRSKILEGSPIDIAMDGVVTRSVRDTAYFYAEAEKFYHNKSMPKMGLVTGPTNRKLKMGYLYQSPTGYADEQTIAELEKTIKLLTDLGHQLKPIDLPVSESFAADFEMTWKMSAWATAKLGRFIIDPSFDSKKLTDYTHMLADEFKFAALPGTVKRMKGYKQEFSQVLKDNDIDIVLTPTLASAPRALAQNVFDLSPKDHFDYLKSWAAFTPLASGTGAPSISLPMGFSADKNLPMGMLFNADFGQDALLLGLAYQIEQAQPWRRITG